MKTDNETLARRVDFFCDRQSRSREKLIARLVRLATKIRNEEPLTAEEQVILAEAEKHIPPREIADEQGYIYHHSALERGYCRRADNGWCESYDGRYGRGIKVHNYSIRTSNQYHWIDYWIKPQRDDTATRT